MEQVRIDPDDFTLGELEEIEQAAGQPITSVLEQPNAKAITAMVYVWMKRGDPAFTLEDARAMRPAEFGIGAERPTKRAARKAS